MSFFTGPADMSSHQYDVTTRHPASPEYCTRASSDQSPFG